MLGVSVGSLRVLSVGYIERKCCRCHVSWNFRNLFTVLVSSAVLSCSTSSFGSTIYSCTTHLLRWMVAFEQLLCLALLHFKPSPSLLWQSITPSSTQAPFLGLLAYVHAPAQRARPRPCHWLDCFKYGYLSLSSIYLAFFSFVMFFGHIIRSFSSLTLIPCAWRWAFHSKIESGTSRTNCCLSCVILLPDVQLL